MQDPLGAFCRHVDVILPGAAAGPLAGLSFAAKDLFIIDNYLDTQVFDVYMENVGQAAQVRVLTQKVSLPLEAVAKKFSARGNYDRPPCIYGVVSAICRCHSFIGSNRHGWLYHRSFGAQPGFGEIAHRPDSKN